MISRNIMYSIVNYYDKFIIVLHTLKSKFIYESFFFLKLSLRKMIKRKINIAYLVKIRKYYTSIYYLNTFYIGLFV